MEKKRAEKIVVIGGGTGVFTVLSGLKLHFKNLSAIVTMADDGGSTGILREDFGVLPPGDIRRALVALSRTDNTILAALFNYRFREGKGLEGHNFGNLLITALQRITGDFESAIREASRILSVQGNVIPVTLTSTRLFAELVDGRIVKGEHNIDIPQHDGRLKIEKIWLVPRARINPAARRVILDADLVVLGPGDLYTSIIPNLLVRGMPEALKKTKAKVLYMVNLMTKFGETHHFRASDFLRAIEEDLGTGVLDYVVVSHTHPRASRLNPYLKEKAVWVKLDAKNFRGTPKLVVADLVRPRGFIRHDPQKIANLILKILSRRL